jgi:hypothetical protein
MSASGSGGHGAHIGIVLGPVLLLAFFAGWSDLRAWMHRQGDQLAPAAVLLAALLTAAAGLAHALVVPAHLAQDPLYGAFFIAAAVTQVGWSAAVVRRPRRPLLAVGLAGNVLLVALWAQTRFVAVPLGVSAGTRESVGALDLTCVLIEVAAAVCCAARLMRSRPGRRRRAADPSFRQVGAAAGSHPQ